MLRNSLMTNTLKCPVCGKTLTQAEYDKALGIWKDKQEHIKHLENEQEKLKRKEFLLKQRAKKQERDFKQREAKLRSETSQRLAKQEQRTSERLRNQKAALESSFSRKIKAEVKKGVELGVALQRDKLRKQEIDLRKSKNKMSQLEKSLKISAKKYDQASEEIKRLKEQIEKGITPQIEGLLEESKLLNKLRELFPHDKFEHPGKGGDIIQFVIERSSEIGRIVYECKRVKHFDRKHIDQAREARRFREADFAVLVTNAFPSKRQYYFVEKSVFVISPISLEPITYTLRESLVRMAMLRMTNEAKQRAVQRVYDYLSSADYNGKMNDIASQLLDLGKELKSEIVSHRRTWKKRYQIYGTLFNDIGAIDYSLRELAHPRLETKPKLLPPPKKAFVQIDELES